jgi:hypothetical protein
MYLCLLNMVLNVTCQYNFKNFSIWKTLSLKKDPNSVDLFLYYRTSNYQPFKRRIKSHLPFANIIRWFNVYGHVHRKYIPIYNQQDATLHSLYLETALHVPGGTFTHHQEHIQLYLQHLVFVTPLLLSAAIVEELEPVWVCCGWRT